MLEQIKKADAIRDRAEAFEAQATSALVKALTGRSFWERQMEKTNGQSLR